MELRTLDVLVRRRNIGIRKEAGYREVHEKGKGKELTTEAI